MFQAHTPFTLHSIQADVIQVDGLINFLICIVLRIAITVQSHVSLRAVKIGHTGRKACYWSNYIQWLEFSSHLSSPFCQFPSVFGFTSSSFCPITILFVSPPPISLPRSLIVCTFSSPCLLMINSGVFFLLLLLFSSRLRQFQGIVFCLGSLCLCRCSIA